MGINNKQRRAAKKRKQQRSGRRPSGPPTGERWWGEFDEHALAGALVLQAVAEAHAESSQTGEIALHLSQAGSVSPSAIRAALARYLADAMEGAVGGGWSPADLAQAVRRDARPDLLPPIAALLADETGRHPADRVSHRWRSELADLGRGEPLDLTTRAGIELGLRLAVLLVGLPVITQIVTPPGVPAAGGEETAGEADRRQLARVRALLAKAESTEYAEEAEALSAKAQELISRHALDELLHRAEAAGDGDGAAVCARRFWIDAPYVVPKAMLLDEVAGANRCRTVLSERPGFSTIVGEPGDLDAVEVLVTSLLVQANAAMLGCGRQSDRWGTSTTTSFRRSFLIAYAQRIGERLRAVYDHVADETGRRDELLPVLRRQAYEVDGAVAELFPELVQRKTQISNHSGWAHGRAAADLALLDRSLNITA